MSYPSKNSVHWQQNLFNRFLPFLTSNAVMTTGSSAIVDIYIYKFTVGPMMTSVSKRLSIAGSLRQIFLPNCLLHASIRPWPIRFFNSSQVAWHMDKSNSESVLIFSKFISLRRWVLLIPDCLVQIFRVMLNALPFFFKFHWCPEIHDFFWVVSCWLHLHFEYPARPLVRTRKYLLSWNVISDRCDLSPRGASGCQDMATWLLAVWVKAFINLNNFLKICQ